MWEGGVVGGEGFDGFVAEEGEAAEGFDGVVSENGGEAVGVLGNGGWKVGVEGGAEGVDEGCDGRCSCAAVEAEAACVDGRGGQGGYLGDGVWGQDVVDSLDLGSVSTVWSSGCCCMDTHCVGYP